MSPRVSPADTGKALHKGKVWATAKALGVSRNTIFRKKDQLPTDLLG